MRNLYQREAVEIKNNELIIAVRWVSRELIEMILENENVSYTQVWQSKYNQYSYYDYKPFCEDGFIVNFFIKGNIHILTLLQWRMSIWLECKTLLEKCYDLQTVNGAI